MHNKKFIASGSVLIYIKKRSIKQMFVEKKIFGFFFFPFGCWTHKTTRIL